MVAAFLKLGKLLLFFCNFEKMGMKCENLSYVILTKHLCVMWLLSPSGNPFFSPASSLHHQGSHRPQGEVSLYCTAEKKSEIVLGDTIYG